MPKPVSPVVPGANLPEVVFAKDQPKYEPLPAHICEEGMVLTRWKFTWRERIRLLCSGDIYVWIWTFRQALQPIAIAVHKPQVTNGRGRLVAILLLCFSLNAPQRGEECGAFPNDTNWHILELHNGRASIDGQFVPTRSCWR